MSRKAIVAFSVGITLAMLLAVSAYLIWADISPDNPVQETVDTPGEGR